MKNKHLKALSIVKSLGDVRVPDNNILSFYASVARNWSVEHLILWDEGRPNLRELYVLLSTLKRNHNLRSFDISIMNYDLDRRCSCLLASALLTCNACSLRQINILLNGLDDKSARMIVDGLATHLNLNSLKLQFQETNSTGWCAALGKKLLQNPKSKLRALDLSCGDIDNAGAIALGRGLAFNKALKELALGQNIDITQLGGWHY